MAAKSSAIARQKRALGKLPNETVSTVSLRSSEVMVREKVIQAQRPSASWWWSWRARRGEYWTASERALFFRQLSTFYSSGIPLQRGILHLAGSALREPLHLRLKELSLALQRGTPFAKAAQASGLFSVLHLGILAAGEGSGELERMLDWLARSEESLTAYRGRLSARLVYPGLVMVCVWLAAPAFVYGLSQVLRSVGENLPAGSLQVGLLPQILLSPLTPALAFLLPPLLLGLCFWLMQRGFWRLGQLPLGLGKLVMDQQSIWLGRVLSQLLAAGLTLTQSLRLASQLGGPHDLRPMLAKIEQGEAVHLSLPESFPPLLATMLAVGEETGEIPELLSRACDILEWNWESRVEAWMAVVEPVMLCLLGLVAGLTVLACAGPLGQLVQSLGN